MKKYLVLFLLLASFTSFGQFVNYTNINGRYKWIAGKFDSTFTLPSGTTPSLRVGGGTGPGALFYNTSDSIVYQYTGSQWRPLHGSDTGRIQIAYVRNTTASQMTTGQVVYINGSTGNVPTVALAINKQDSTSAMTFGFVRGTIPVNGFGWITTFGPIDGINTNAYTEGEVIYLDSIAGQFTHYKPQAPYHMVTLGYVIKKAANGILFVKIQNGYELEELHNVKITAPILNKSVLIYDSANRLWVDTTLSAAGMAVSSINTSSATGILGGPITTTGTISADTTLLSTRLWRQKGIDSVTSLINARPSGSGTTNYLSKWTSSSALGNSVVNDNGTSVGIGTTNISGVAGSTNLFIRNSSGTRTELMMSNSGQADGTRTAGLISLGSEFSVGSFISGGRLIFWANGSDFMRLEPTGRLLVGTSTDNGQRLQVSGTALITGDANINGLTVGKGGGSVATNTAVGFESINGSATGTENAAFGYRALKAITTANGNTAVGVNSSVALTTGSQNTTLGYNTGAAATTAGRNTLIGYIAGQSVTSDYNTIVGWRAGSAATSGSVNTLVGADVGLNITTGSNNNLFGSSITGITTGSYNTIIGANVTGLSASLSNTIILADGQGNQRLYINNSGLVSVGGNTIFEGGFNVTRNSTISSGNTAGIVINATNTAGNTELLLGASEGSLASYIQSASQNSSWTNRPLLLQPNGGNVGIGKSPSFALDINGTANATSLRSGDIQSSGSISFNNYTTDATIWGIYAVSGSGTTISSGGSDAVSFRTGGTEKARITNAGRLLIGTTTESTYLLDVNGTARVSGDALINTLTIGLGGGSVSTNTAIGFQAINATATGAGNVAVGYQAGRAITSGVYNVFVGFNAGVNLTTGSYNYAVGLYAGRQLTTGTQNVLLGYNAGASLTTQGNNVYIGHSAADASTSSSNVAIGYQAMQSNTTGNANTALGNVAGKGITTGGSNTVIGSDAGLAIATGSSNVLLGRYAGNALTSSTNTAIGAESLYSLTTGANNTALGYIAGRYVTAGTANQTSANSTYLGYDTRASADGNTNEIVIGYQARGNGSNTVTLGNTSIVTTVLQGSVAIGTTSPNASALLDVSSTTKGFLPPRMTNAQMLAITTPAAGLVVYDTTNNKLNVYDGTNWVTLH